jgi:predicted small lipoprotein YifL
MRLHERLAVTAAGALREAIATRRTLPTTTPADVRALAHGHCCKKRERIFRNVDRDQSKTAKRMATAARSALIVMLLTSLSSCVIKRPLHLYPTGDKSTDAVVLDGLFVGHGKGRGTARIDMPDGEVLQGEYSIVFGGAVGFGSILGSAYGPNGSASISGTSANVSIEGKGEGEASLVGNRGTTMECEFLNANMTGHGFGACRSSRGILYRLMY